MSNERKEEAYEAMFKAIKTLLNDWIAFKVPEIENRLEAIEERLNRIEEYIKIGDYREE